jgi:phospholipid/cholesterol/gamma-HCH transport system substrate-binding protein
VNTGRRSQPRLGRADAERTGADAARRRIDHAFRRTVAKLLIFIVVATAITSMVVATLLDQTTTPVVSYHAIVSDVTGLQPGDTVRIAGVQVGQITSVGLHGDDAELTFTVDQSDPLPATTQADVRFADLLGQRYLELAPGADGTAVDSRDRLRPGATIPLSRTQPSLDLTQVFDGFQPLFSALQPNQVNQLAGDIVAILQGQTGSIADLVSSTATLVTNLAQRQQILTAVIDNLNRLLVAVGSHDQQVGTLIDALDQLATGLASDGGPIGTAITSVGQLETTVAGLLNAAQPALNQDISDLATSAGTLASNQQGLDATLTGLPGLLSSLNKVSSSGNYLNVYLCNLTLDVTGEISNLAAPLTLPSGPVGNQSEHTAVCQ